MVHAEECRRASFTIQMEMGRTYRKNSPHQIGAGNNDVRSLQRRKAEAGQVSDRLFRPTSWDHIGQKWRKREMSGKC